MPMAERKKMNVLVDSLKESGPVQPSFRNYSKLGQNRYYCHLFYGWVVCWSCEKELITIEVYYAGSCEKAPY